MDFQHLYSTWHLVTNQDTILAKVFKAKYYPKDGFLDAKLGHKEDYDCG
jgi:hypothetical protein